MAEDGKAVVEIWLKARFDDAKKALDGIAGQLRTLEDKVWSAKAAWLGFGAAIGGLIYSLNKMAGASKDAEMANAKLWQSLRSIGQATDKNIKLLSDQADALGRTTNFSDEAVKSAQSLLATYKLSVPEIASLTPKLADMASAMNMSIEQAAMLVGRSMNYGLGMLRRYGVAVDDATRKTFEHGNQAQRLAMIQDLLAQRFSGSASAMASSSIMAANAFGEVEEQIGGIYRIFTSFKDKVMAAVFNWFLALSPNVRLLAYALVGLTAATVVLVPAFLSLGAALSVVGAAAVSAGVSFALLAGEIVIVAAAGAALGLLMATLIDGMISGWSLLKSTLMNIVGDVKDVLLGFSDVLIGIFTGNVGLMKDGARQLKNGLVNGLSDALSAGADVVSLWGDKINTSMKAVTDKLGGAMNNIPKNTGGGPGGPIAEGTAYQPDKLATYDQEKQLFEAMNELRIQDAMTMDEYATMANQINDKMTANQYENMSKKLAAMKQEHAARIQFFQAMITSGASAASKVIQIEYAKGKALAGAGRIALSALRAAGAAQLQEVADWAARKIAVYGAESAAASMKTLGFPAGVPAALASIAFYTGLAAVVSAAGGIAASRISPPSGGGGSMPADTWTPPGSVGGGNDALGGGGMGSGGMQLNTGAKVEVNVYGDNFNDPLMAQRIAAKIAEEQALQSN